MIKRAFDTTGALLALIVFLPLMLIVSVAILMTMGSPILFQQARPGLQRRPFKVMKFRTMSNKRDSEGNLLPDELRLTALGRWLRKTSIDELPEFFNVLKGEMSLVGPRPLLMKYLEIYTPEQDRRHTVRPGITGWTQVNGRNLLTWDKKFDLDLWYVDNHSFWLDLKILALTLVKVVMREGVSAEGHATMPEFGEEEGLK